MYLKRMSLMYREPNTIKIQSVMYLINGNSILISSCTRVLSFLLVILVVSYNSIGLFFLYPGQNVFIKTIHKDHKYIRTTNRNVEVYVCIFLHVLLTVPTYFHNIRHQHEQTLEDQNVWLTPSISPPARCFERASRSF